MFVVSSSPIPPMRSQSSPTRLTAVGVYCLTQSSAGTPVVKHEKWSTMRAVICASRWIWLIAW